MFLCLNHFLNSRMQASKYCIEITALEENYGPVPEPGGDPVSVGGFLHYLMIGQTITPRFRPYLIVTDLPSWQEDYPCPIAGKLIYDFVLFSFNIYISLFVLGCGKRPKMRRTQLIHLVECHSNHPLMLSYIHKLLNLNFSDAHAFSGRMATVAEDSEDSDASSEISLPVRASAAAGAAAISRLSLSDP